MSNAAFHVDIFKLISFSNPEDDFLRQVALGLRRNLSIKSNQLRALYTQLEEDGPST